MTKIRFLIVAPASYICVPSEEFDSHEEAMEITNKVDLSPFGDSFELRSRSGLSVKRLGTLLLRHHPQILHLISHGNPSRGIAWTDPEGMKIYIGTEDFARFFRVFKDDICLAFLNICHSRPYAEAIAQDIDFVVGIDGSIEDGAAVDFAGSFYQGLGLGMSVKDAFDRGTSQLNSRDSEMRSEAPLLLVRQGVKDEPFLSYMDHKATENAKHTDKGSSLQGVRKRLLAELQESIKARREEQTGDGEEFYRFQSDNGRFRLRAILERDGGLTFRYSTIDLDMEGEKIQFRLGPLTQEITAQRLSESQVGWVINFPRRQRPRNLADISLELAF